MTLRKNENKKIEDTLSDRRVKYQQTQLNSRVFITLPATGKLTPNTEWILTGILSVSSLFSFLVSPLRRMQADFQKPRVFFTMRLFLLLLVLLLSHVAIVTAVAGCHSDRDKDHRPRENCTGAGFSDIPAGVEPKTKVTTRYAESRRTEETSQFRHSI